MNHPLPTHRAASTLLALLVAGLAALARAGEPVALTGNMVYPVEYVAETARLFERVELPLLHPPPADARLALRYCSGGQARLLAPEIDGHRLRAWVYVPPHSKLCAEVVALSPTAAATDPERDGLVRVDRERDRQELDRIRALDGSPPVKSEFPAWLSYLLVLIGFAGLVLAIAYALFHLVQRLRELSGRVQELQQELAQSRTDGFELSGRVQQLQQDLAQQRTIGFVLRGLRVETAPGGKSKREHRVVVTDGHAEQSGTLTERHATILNDILDHHPLPLSRLSSNPNSDEIHPTEVKRLREELAMPLGALLALQLIQNKKDHLLFNPHLYCPPAAGRPPEG